MYWYSVIIMIIIFSRQVWPVDSVRNAIVGGYCGYNKGLVFGSTKQLWSGNTSSRSLLTKIYYLNENPTTQTGTGPNTDPVSFDYIAQLERKTISNVS